MGIGRNQYIELMNQYKSKVQSHYTKCSCMCTRLYRSLIYSRHCWLG